MPTKTRGPSSTKLHLCVPHLDHLEYDLTRQLGGEHFKIVSEVAESKDAVFVDDGGGLAALETWLTQTAGVAPRRWVCTPRLSAVVRRGLPHAEDVGFLVPHGMNLEEVRARLLGELYLHRGGTQKTMIGRSHKMRELCSRLDTFAPTDEPVLILGESGTGKELCAHYLHEKRGKGSLYSVNCADLKPAVIESELFGHAKGAFTGAASARPGLLRQCGKGTCFLDEIGDLHSESQAVLLRFIENRKLRPLGSDHYKEFHGRLITATHRDLETASTEGGYRHDLYSRLAHLNVSLPPLRERMEDVPLLVNHFIEVFNKRYDKTILPPSSYDCFFRHGWPGNVRQLKTWISEAVLTQEEEAHQPLDTHTIEDRIFRDNLPKPDPVGVVTIPFYPADDHWTTLRDRARKTFLGDALTRCGKINPKMEELTCTKRSKIYEELKAFGLK